VRTARPGIGFRFILHREYSRTQRQSEQDDDEIDEGLDRQMDRKRHLAKRSAKRLGLNINFERGQNDRNHGSGHDSARHTVECEEWAASHHRMNVGIKCANHGRNEREPNNQAKRVRQRWKRRHQATNRFRFTAAV
jgi:hypothetical protein